MSTRYVWEVSQKASNYKSQLYDSHIQVSDDTRFTFVKDYDFDTNTGLYRGTISGTSYTPGSVSSGQVVVTVGQVGRYFMRGDGYNKASLFQTTNNQANWYIFRSDNGQITVNSIPTSGGSGVDIYEYRGVEESSGSTHIKYVSGNSRSSYSDGVGPDGYTYTYRGSDTIDPSSVTYSTTSPTAGKSITIRATTRTPTYGGTIYYQFSYSTDGGNSWTNIGSKSTTASASVTIPSGATQFMGRVIASDDWGFTSTTYVTGSNLTVSAPITYYKVTLSVSPSAGGTVTGADTYASGSSVTVKATPNDGYKFVRWEKNGSSVSTSSSYTFRISANTALTAVFETDIRAYVGVNAKAGSLKKGYVGVTAKARSLIKGYVGVGGVAKKLF